MKKLLVIAAVVGAVAAGAVFAQSGAEVLKTKGCLNCHEADKKKVGPSFKDIAAKYKDDKGAQASLTAKIKDGKGHAKAAASDAEINAAVGQILSTK